MKNLSDLSVKMSDEANIVGLETDDLKIYGGVNFIALGKYIYLHMYIYMYIYVCIYHINIVYIYIYIFRH
jgi:hypothetical protein